MSAIDIQVGGDHYKKLKTQPVEFWHANLMGASEGACVKYVSRWRDKDGVKDLRKVRHFLLLIIEDEPYQRLYAAQREAFPFYSGMGMRAEEFIESNGLKNQEAGVVRHVWYWHLTANPAELQSALRWADDLLAAACG